MNAHEVRELEIQLLDQARLCASIGRVEQTRAACAVAGKPAEIARGDLAATHSSGIARLGRPFESPQLARCQDLATGDRWPGTRLAMTSFLAHLHAGYCVVRALLETVVVDVHIAVEQAVCPRCGYC